MYISFTSSHIIIFIAITHYSSNSAVKQRNQEPARLGLKPPTLQLNVQYYNLMSK